MGFEYHMHTVRGWRGDAPLPFERIDAVEADLDGGCRGEFVEDYFRDLARAHREDTFAALFVSDRDQWVLWVADAGKAREAFLALVGARTASAARA